MTEIYYFAYGSNLHPLRLQKRISSAVPLEVIKVTNFVLSFHKRGADASGKCNIVPSDNASDQVFGVVYKMLASQKNILDEIEGAGYQVCFMEWNDKTCFYYAAEDDYIDEELRPYTWYRQLVLLGAQYHGLPKEYWRKILAVNCVNDPDVERQNINSTIISDLEKY